MLDNAELLIPESNWLGYRSEVAHLIFCVAIEAVRILGPLCPLEGVLRLCSQGGTIFRRITSAFFRSKAIITSLQIHNWPILISGAQMWTLNSSLMAVHLTHDGCGHYRCSQRSPWPRHDRTNRCDWSRHRLSERGRQMRTDCVSCRRSG